MSLVLEVATGAVRGGTSILFGPRSAKRLLNAQASSTSVLKDHCLRVVLALTRSRLRLAVLG